MPPILISPVIKITLGVAGAAAAALLAVKEMRRAGEELDRNREMTNLDRAARKALPTLRRDPHSGEWRIV